MKFPFALRQHYRRAKIAFGRLLGAELYEKLKFLAAHHRWPRLAPAQTFNEKVLIRKLRSKDARFPLISDKIAVRDWVAQRIGSEHLIPMLTAYRYEDLDTLQVVPGHVIKCANRSGGVYFVNDSQTMDRQRLIASLKRDLDFDFPGWSGEPWYAEIPKRVIVEKQLRAADGSIPRDYKFLVFDGVVRVIQVDMDRFLQHKRGLFDRDWNVIPAAYKQPLPAELPARPQRLDEMLEIAETIGREFDFIRVDLYEINDKTVYFGELTLAPASGLGRFSPVEYDKRFGDFWHQTDSVRPRQESRLDRFGMKALDVGAQREQSHHSALRK